MVGDHFNASIYVTPVCMAYQCHLTIVTRLPIFSKYSSLLLLRI